MRGSAKYGIGAIVIAGIAWVLLNLFNIDLGGVGLSPNLSVDSQTESDESPDDVNDSKPTADDETADHNAEQVVNSGSEQLVAEQADARSIDSRGVLDIRIAGRDYHLRDATQADAVWKPADLKSVLALAKQAPGDDAGVRVRILRSENSRASAESELVEALQGEGIAKEAIEIPETLVE